MALWTMTDEAAGKPKYLSDELRNAQTVSDKDATIGINAAEAADEDSRAVGLKTPGWVSYTTYTDANGNVRHKSEVLVAAGSMGSDGTETLADDLGGGGIDASTLTVQTGIQLYAGNTLYFFNQTTADQFKAASPTSFYYVDGTGAQSLFEGRTLGNVTSSGPYKAIALTGGTVTAGTYLTGATNSRIYY